MLNGLWRREFGDKGTQKWNSKGVNQNNTLSECDATNKQASTEQNNISNVPNCMRRIGELAALTGFVYTVGILAFSLLDLAFSVRRTNFDRDAHILI